MKQKKRFKFPTNFMSKSFSHQKTIINVLLTIQHKFLEASEKFQKNKSYSNASHCTAYAELLKLQILDMSVQYINLNKQNKVFELLEKVSSFQNAVVIANAYKIIYKTEWFKAPIYKQVVINGNFKYFQDFVKLFSSDPKRISEVFLDVALRFKNDNFKPNEQAKPLENLKRFLTLCEDRFTLYKIALNLSFEDIMVKIKQEIPNLQELI